MTNEQDLRPIFMDDQGKMKYVGDDGRLHYLDQLGRPVTRWSYYFGHSTLVVVSLFTAIAIVCATIGFYLEIVRPFLYYLRTLLF